MSRHILSSLAALFALVAPAAAQQTGGGAEVSAGAAWSSTRGAIVSIGLEGENILQSGIDLGLEYREGEKGQDGRLRLRYVHEMGDTRLGTDTRLILSGLHSRSNWDDDGYATARSRLGLAVSARVARQIRVQGGVFWQEDSINDIKIDTSPLILSEQGHSDTVGIELTLSFGEIDHRQLPGHGQMLDLTWTSAFAGDRHFDSLEMNAVIARRPAPDWALSLRLGGGAIEARDGQSLSIHDRAFLGGKAPRGFGIGGVGPRDYLADVTDTALGGSRYVLASVELRRDISERFMMGAFVDAGSVWKLDGAPVGAGGPVDDSYDLRSAAGLSLYWKTGLGIVNVSFAAPLSHREHDSVNRVSLNLISSF